MDHADWQWITTEYQTGVEEGTGSRSSWRVVATDLSCVRVIMMMMYMQLLLLCLVARDLLAAGRVQFKNCVLHVSEPACQTQSNTDITSTDDTQADTEQPQLIDDTIQVSYVSRRFTFGRDASVQFSSVYLIPFRQLHDKIQTRIRT